MSKNASEPHKISLTKNWGPMLGETDAPGKKAPLAFYRIFHAPTGVTNIQDIRFCFRPCGGQSQLILNQTEVGLSILNELAVARLNGLLGPVNRLEIRWFDVQAETSQLPEHFEAWLEIYEVSSSNA